ncbi:hypothetical protein [Thioclava kandeliae]|uniref:Uncharacterized protein n=1 Tax=Thioclava kandeliae TaxID=3070818 RepID=A0ABV1SMI0_9RHOB
MSYTISWDTIEKVRGAMVSIGRVTNPATGQILPPSEYNRAMLGYYN